MPGATSPIYLNGDGGTYVPGQDDSTTNTSVLLLEESEVPAFPYGPGSWTSLVECVQGALAPYQVAVTDQDPGAVDHVEIVVTTTASVIDVPPSGGVSPSTCEFNERAIAFVFAQAPTVGDTPEGDLCWKTAWAIGAASTLQNVDDCSDLMAGSDYCGTPRFRDADVGCTGGGDECACDLGPTQNSDERLAAVYGRAACGE